MAFKQFNFKPFTGKQPIYQQLIDQLIGQIRSQSLQVGERLPTSRSLAHALKINRNTVVKVYDHLKQSGYLQSRVGRGTVVANPVANLDTLASREVPWSSLLTRAAQHLPTRQTLPQHDDDIRLSRMQPDETLLPLLPFQTCLNQALCPGAESSLVYGSPSGSPRLRELIRQELAHMGVEASHESIIITNGSSQAMDLVLRSLVNEGDKVLLEDPTYHGGIMLLKLAGAQLVAIPSDSQGPDVHRLPSHMLKEIKLCYLIPNYRNPTSTSISAPRRQEIAKWAQTHGILIIEDDYAFELGFDGPTPRPLKHWAPNHVIYANSFSKRLFPALRLGYLVVPPGLLAEKLHTLKWITDLGSSSLLQEALVQFIEGGHYQRYLESSMRQYRLRRDAVHAALARLMPSEVHWNLPAGGLFFWLQLPAGINIETLMLKCAERHVQISGGHVWSANDSPLAGIRLTFCSEETPRLLAGIQVLADEIRNALPYRRNHEQETRNP